MTCGKYATFKVMKVGRRLRGRSRRRQDDDIKVDLKKINGMTWRLFIWPRLGNIGGLL
jgi:hypothetical protein